MGLVAVRGWVGGAVSRPTGPRGHRRMDLAREHLATALAMYSKMDMRFWLGQMEAERT